MVVNKKATGIFILKLFAAVISVVLLLSFINGLYIKGYYYRDTYGETEKMKDVPYGIKMVNTGTSHGLASFHYPKEYENTYNLALSGEDIYHDFQTLKQFSNHFEKGCIVAIPVSYFSFCMSTEEPSQKRYYTYLDKEKIRDFTYETLLSAKYLPVLKSGEYIIKDLINDQEMDIGAQMMADRENVPEEDVVYNASNQNANSVSDETQNTNTPTVSEDETDADVLKTVYGLSAEERNRKNEYLASHAAGRVESWRSGYMINGRIYINKNTEILKEMVNFCYEQGFRPLLVTTPIYTALNEEFTEEELDICYFDNMKKVQKETGVPYLELSHDSELSFTPDYFDNSDHLNRYGAVAFWEKYITFLKQVGYY